MGERRGGKVWALPTERLGSALCAAVGPTQGGAGIWGTSDNIHPGALAGRRVRTRGFVWPSRWNKDGEDEWVRREGARVPDSGWKLGARRCRDAGEGEARDGGRLYLLGCTRCWGGPGPARRRKSSGGRTERGKAPRPGSPKGRAASWASRSGNTWSARSRRRRGARRPPAPSVTLSGPGPDARFPHRHRPSRRRRGWQLRAFARWPGRAGPTRS